MKWGFIAVAGLALAAIIAVMVRYARQPRISPEQLQALIEKGDGILILDVRSLGEFNSGHIPGAVHRPHAEVRSSPDAVPRPGSESIVVYCELGPRALLAQKALIKSGRTNVLHLQGDMAGWRAKGLPVEVTPP